MEASARLARSAGQPYDMSAPLKQTMAPLGGRGGGKRPRLSRRLAILRTFRGPLRRRPLTHAYTLPRGDFGTLQRMKIS
jgi:hypothetical protein